MYSMYIIQDQYGQIISTQDNLNTVLFDTLSECKDAIEDYCSLVGRDGSKDQFSIYEVTLNSPVVTYETTYTEKHVDNNPQWVTYPEISIKEI